MLFGGESGTPESDVPLDRKIRMVMGAIGTKKVKRGE